MSVLDRDDGVDPLLLWFVVMVILWSLVTWST
jgi:hypothetical protein